MHVAIIMDGNGRWATRRGLPRTAGHRAGARTLTRIAEAAPSLGVTELTVFAFSSDNWRRPAAEVDALMKLFRAYLCNESERHARKGTRLSVIGRRDRLSPGLADEISRVEAETAQGDRLHLRVALDYSARDSISRVVAAAGEADRLSRDALGRLISQCRPADPHGRRKASVRLSALGMRLRRTGVSRRHVARFHIDEPRRRDRRLSGPRAPLRRTRPRFRRRSDLTRRPSIRFRTPEIDSIENGRGAGYTASTAAIVCAGLLCRWPALGLPWSAAKYAGSGLWGRHAPYRSARDRPALDRFVRPEGGQRDCDLCRIVAALSSTAAGRFSRHAGRPAPVGQDILALEYRRLSGRDRRRRARRDRDRAVSKSSKIGRRRLLRQGRRRQRRRNGRSRDRRRPVLSRVGRRHRALPTQRLALKRTIAGGVRGSRGRDEPPDDCFVAWAAGNGVGGAL